MFEVHQCTHPNCRLRLPLDPGVYRGAYCPRCGAPMIRVGLPYENPQTIAEIQPKRVVRVLLDNVRSTYNTGAIFRTADGVGATHLYLCGITPNPTDNPAIQKTSLGAELALSWSVHPDACALGEDLLREGFRLIGLETTPDATPLFEVDSESIGGASLVLVAGNEQAGIDPGLLALCDLVLVAPMIGSKASLNVAVAFGLAAYWLTFL
jgi:23S rRNA (guanosine2251-2'-O)-methyltransferase